MRKFGKWFLVGLILVLVLATCSNYRKPPYSNWKKSYFLDRILNRILQGAPQGYRDDLNIYTTSESSNWAAASSKAKIIVVNEYLLLIAKNEAEIAATIAHEIGHFVNNHFGPPAESEFASIEKYVKVRLERENIADRTAIELLARAGYDTFSAINIMQREIEENDKLIAVTFNIDIEFIRKIAQGDVAEDSAWQKARLDFNYEIAKKYSSNKQKEWVLFSAKDLEKLKCSLRKSEFIKKIENLNGE